MGSSNISSLSACQEQNTEAWMLPSCNEYLCPLLPLRLLIPVTAVCLALLVLGVGGNVLTVVVTSYSRELRNTTSLYLGSLAVSDLLLLLLGLPLDLYRLWRPDRWVLGTMLCQVWHWSGEACAYCSILHLTALTAERYIAICFPLRAKLLVTQRRVKALLLVLWTVASLSAAPFLFLVGVQQVGNISSDGGFRRECGPTTYAQETGLLGTMLGVTTLYFVLPCLCLYILHGLIARELLRASKAHLGGASYRNHQQTLRMLANCYYLYSAFSFLQGTHGGLYCPPPVKFILTTTHASINPILYNFASKKYRAAIYKLLVTTKSTERASTITKETLVWKARTNHLLPGETKGI
uniref:Motilin receptor n=1 Tax=Varanus komodoensis TaxID=61221 RepID=A0A8D2J819_VARKO